MRVNLLNVRSCFQADFGFARPGSGLNLKHFNREKITKLYLVEPCIGLHEELKANVKKAGLDNVAVIIR